MATKAQHEKADRQQDQAVDDSFPASDAPANSGITGADEAADAKPANPGDVTPEPTGTPTSDRHATETTHHAEHEQKP